MAALSDMLVYLRKRAKLSQQEVADKLEISRSAIGMYEAGRREPDLETLEAFADFYNVDMNTLVGRSIPSPSAGQSNVQITEKTATFGEKLKALRLEKGLSQDQLAEVLGTSKQVISRYETNQRTPKITVAQQYADRLGVSLGSLIDNSIDYNGLQPPSVTEEVVTFRAHVDIAAGYDHPAEPLADWEGDSIEVPVSYLHGRPMNDYFMIRIKGHSMYPHYQAGDYVLVLKADTLDYSGQIGVLLHGDEGTIKKIEYMPGEDWLKLIPLNPEYMPKTIEGAELETCRIIGIPKLIMRDVN